MLSVDMLEVERPKRPQSDFFPVNGIAGQISMGSSIIFKIIFLIIWKILEEGL